MSHVKLVGRLRPILAAGVATFALLVSACGGGTPSGGEDDIVVSEDLGLLPAAEGNTQYPLTLETPWGNTVLEERPERIATIGFTGVDTEIALALGATPVYAGGFEGFLWMEEAGSGEIEATTPATELAKGNYPYEELANVDPDLIIATGMDLEPHFEKFQAIAPVLAAESEDQMNATVFDWKKRLPIISEALDLTDAGDAFVDEYEQRAAEVRAAHPEFADQTVSFLIYYPTSIQFGYDTVSWLGEFFGFRPAEAAEEFTHERKVSPELFSKVDADVLILTENTSEPIDTLISEPYFQSLDAVKNDHLVVIEHAENVAEEGNFPAAIGFAGPLGKLWAADRLLTAIEEQL